MIFPCVCCIWILLPRLVYGIVGGVEGNSLEPSKGVVLIDNGYGINLPPFCAGALISSQFVLTNGQCCAQEFKETVIHLGSTSPFESGQFYQLAAYEHIGEAISNNYQLCVIKLEREVKFNANCFPLALPTKHNAIGDTNQILYAFGYGSIMMEAPEDPIEIAILNYNYKRVLSNELMALELPLQEERLCLEVFQKPDNISLTLRCHGYTAEPTKRLMYDDNGAPVVGSKDNVVYTIMGTYAPLKPGINTYNESYPLFGLDVFSARDDILGAMDRLLKGTTDNE